MSQCYICGEDNPNVLETHHLIPRRYGGEDSNENTVSLCANCHAAVESLYGRRFYERLAQRLLDSRSKQATNQRLEEGKVEIKQPEDGQLYECPICGRTKNRKGVPFKDPVQVAGHISGCRDDDHADVIVDLSSDEWLKVHEDTSQSD